MIDDITCVTIFLEVDQQIPEISVFDRYDNVLNRASLSKNNE